MDAFWYYASVALQKILRALPLTVVARIGRIGGAVTYLLDGRHRRIGMVNLTKSYPEKSPTELRRMLREHFRRLGENFSSAVKTSGMTAEEMRPHLEVVGSEKIRAHGKRGAICAVGHFGNFEVYASAKAIGGDLPMATTYRGLDQPRLDALVRQMRVESGTMFFDRRRQGEELRQALSQGGIVLGLLCDHHAGSRGVRIQFFGNECSATPAPALFAQRYHMPLHPAICFRVGLARWRVEIGDEIPTRSNGVRRPAADIMAEVHQAFEAGIRRDPPNWFWCHDRWRFGKGLRDRKPFVRKDKKIAAP
jgi:Kdo2-lipid IVA lauroyltransferase/acyltransferase